MVTASGDAARLNATGKDNCKGCSEATASVAAMATTLGDSRGSIEVDGQSQRAWVRVTTRLAVRQPPGQKGWRR